MMTETFSWGASCIGPAHIKNNIPNQDSWSIEHVSEVPCTIYVVADGLGSYTNSHIGSGAVAESVKRAVLGQEGMDELGVIGDLERFCSRIQWSWCQKLQELHIPIETAYTTCLVVIELNKHLVFVQIGDGVLLAFDTQTEETLFCTPRNENHFSNITLSLEETFVPQNWQMHHSEKPAEFAIMMCTDGISNDLLEEKPINYLLNLLHTSKRLTAEECAKEMKIELENWPVPHHYDDKTIIFAGCWK